MPPTQHELPMLPSMCEKSHRPMYRIQGAILGLMVVAAGFSAWNAKALSSASAIATDAKNALASYHAEVESRDKASGVVIEIRNKTVDRVLDDLKDQLGTNKIDLQNQLSANKTDIQAQLDRRFNASDTMQKEQGERLNRLSDAINSLLSRRPSP